MEPDEIAYRSTGVGDRALGAVSRNESRMIRQPDDDALLQHACHGVLDERSRVLVDDVEHVLDGSVPSLFLLPSSEAFRDGIEPRHPRTLVRRDDTVADAVESRRKAGFTLPHGLLCVPTLGQVARHLHVADDRSRVVSHGADDDIRPEARPVLSNSPALVLHASGGGSRREQAPGFAGGDILGRVKKREVAADDLTRLVLLDGKRALIPGRDLAVRVEQEDGVIANAIEKWLGFLVVPRRESMHVRP